MAAVVVRGEDGGADFPDVSIPTKFVINQQGKDHILFAGLVDALHQLSGGFFRIDTRIEQLPTAENGHTAVCSARVEVFDPGDLDAPRRGASGIGDASPANVNRMMATALIRMAETRAKARALRDLCNVGMVSFEELGLESEARGSLQETPPAPAPPAPLSPPVTAPPPVERIEVEGQVYTRPQVEVRFIQRREKAKALGIALPPEVVALVAAETPLRDLVGETQKLRRLCEATQAGQR